jgi:hypothetical protein
MKTTTIFALAAALLATPLAVAEGGKQQNHQERAARMQQQFGISDEQIAEMRSIRQNGGTREEAHAILSEGQQQQMHEWRQSNPKKGSHGKGNHGEQHDQDSSDNAQ